MELYKEILVSLLSGENMEVTFPGLKLNVNQILESKCYRALEKVKAIIEDENLDDRECFMKIEAIICELEELGSGGGLRHDFG